MKKICLSLLLTTNVVFVSCMEKERLQTIPVYLSHTSTFITPHPYTTNNQHIFQPPIYCEANEPGWEFYDEIANMTYHNNQPAMNQVQLTPVYKPAKTTIVQQEQKSLLQTNSLKPDIPTMQDLYLKAAQLIDYSDRRTSLKLQKETFVNLISQMNVAKNKNIHEDTIGQFAYKNYIDGIGRHERTVLFFSILKRYNITVQQTGEQLPSDYSQISCNFDQYPAFFKTVYSLSSAYSDIPLVSIEIFNNYVYGNQDILLKDYSDGSYKDFKNEFYDKAYNLLLQWYTDLNLFHLLQVIDKAKEVGDIINDDDLINYMTHFTKPKSPTDYFYSLFDSSYNDDNVRKKIIHFCELVKDYNNKRHYKITPTPNQFHVYCVKTLLDIPLSEFLTNKDLLDGNSYAFAEFKELQEATVKLRQLNADGVNELYGNSTK